MKRESFWKSSLFLRLTQANHSRGYYPFWLPMFKSSVKETRKEVSIFILKDTEMMKFMKSYQFPVEFPMSPTNTDLEQDPSMIAIFFAIQDILPEKISKESGVYMRMVILETEKNETLRQRLLNDFDSSMACTVGYVPRFALIITWKNMTYANKKEDRPLKVN